MTKASQPQDACATTEFGCVSFALHDGGAARFTLNYRDPRQECVVELTWEGITRAADQLRDRAVAAMHDIVQELSDELLPQLSSEGYWGDYIDAEFTGHPASDWRLVGNRLIVELPPNYLTVDDEPMRSHAPRFLAEEFLRGCVRRRTLSLWNVYEEIRRDALDEWRTRSPSVLRRCDRLR